MPTHFPTYYEVLDDEDKPIPSQARKFGTSGYGYKTLYDALGAQRRAMWRYSDRCWSVRERHTCGYNDWAGNWVTHQGTSIDDQILARTIFSPDD